MRILVFLFVLVSFVSCSLIRNSNEEADQFAALSSEEQFYRTANEQLNSSNFQAAIVTYQELESRFPFGQFAAQAQLELIYAHYRSSNLEAARSAADRFIRLNPDHPNIDYAYYMKGVASFNEDSRFMSRFLPVDQSKRDSGGARDAFNEFSLLLALYPDSDYAADARARMVFLRNNLATSEIHVANFYLDRRAYIAALNRGRYVVENFQGSPLVADGMAIMIESYLRLGLNDLADTSLTILKENYPDHPSIDANGNFIVRPSEIDPSLLYTATFGLFGSNADNTPLAPTTRPVNPQRPAPTQPAQRSRSWLSRLTFGIFG
ncbi:MAG: outer membrane protein assembly factor BamD [Pseudomonadales bacterium]|nr:outer membrane protein assembly factor BamD [Pseudomonadales bacterium]